MAPVSHNFATHDQNPGLRIIRESGVLKAGFNSDPAHLAAVRAAVEALSAEAGFEAKPSGEIGLAVNEAIANIIRHAYGRAGDMPIEMTANVKAGAIEITLRDWGSGECPAASSHREPMDPLTPGGLGLVCMHRLMDEVLFTPQPRGMLLTMRRKIAS